MKKPRHAFLSLPLGMRGLGRILLALPDKIRRRTATSAGILPAFARRIQPRPFFAGLLLGAVTMLGLGQWAKRHDTFGDRIRFFQAVSPERGIYPTIDNLAAFVRGKADPKKILVLVAGSSICLGIGQPEEDLWSRKLQEKLGQDFCVVNMSFRSSRYNLVGLPLIRMLRKEYPHSVFVSDFGPNDRGPTSIHVENPNVPYNYLSWQLLAREFLKGSPEVRGEIFGEFLQAGQVRKNYVLERFLSGIWETVTGASAFWNWVGYRLIFTANPWRHSMKPIHLIRDDDCRENYLPSPERFQPNRASEMSILQRQIQQGRLLNFPQARAECHSELMASFPDKDSSRRAIFLVNAWSSFYVDQLDSNDRLFYQQMVSRQVDDLRNLEFGAVAIGLGYPYSYYVDGQHFSWEAAPAMAAAVAKEVQRVSRERGY